MDLEHEAQRSELLRIASSEMARLADRTGEAVVLALPVGDEAVSVDELGKGQQVGRRPLRRTAIGEAIAANLDWAARRSWLDRTAEAEFAARLDLVRARGYAIELDEFVAGTSSVAAPIIDRSGRAIAAIGIEGPSERLSQDKLHDFAPVLVEATSSISTHFGGVLRPLSKSPQPSVPRSPSVRLLADTKNLIGECPLYDARDDRLFWVDMYNPAIFRFERKTGKLTSFMLGEMVTALAFMPEGLLIAARSGLWLADPDTFERIRHMGHPEPHIPTNRFNDGKCDGRGRFWINTIDLDFRAGAGALYCMEPSGSFATADAGLTLPNGMGWSSDGRTMYLVETKERAIYAYDFDEDAGRLANRRVLIRIPDNEHGAPDGMAVDPDGNLLVALFDGWRVSQFSPQGRLIRDIVMPVPRPTSCAIGGPDGRTLFVTSARIRISELTLRQAPHSGAVFEIAL